MAKILVMAALAGLTVLLLKESDLLPAKGAARSGVYVFVALAFAARLLLLDNASSAIEDELLEAVSYFRGAGGFWGVRSYYGSYAVGMQYLLALCALVPRGSVYVFKYVCAAADVGLAWACSRCAGSVLSRGKARLHAFLLALLLPAAVMESAGGMGMSLVFLFPVLAASAALRGNFRLCGLCLALGVAMSPDTLWLLPAFLLFPAVREHLGRTTAWVCGSYFTAALPALLLGRPTNRTLPFYPAPMEYFSRNAQRGAPGLYFLLPNLTKAAGIGVYAALLAVTVVFLCGREATYDRRRQLAGLCFVALSMGAFLPGMSPAVLLGGEALCVALCVLEPGMIPAAVGASFASALAVVKIIAPSVAYPTLWAAAALYLALLFLLFKVLFRQ